MKYKVFNNNNFPVGLISMDGKIESKVPANSFNMLEEDDIYYTNNVCSLFREGVLICENKDIMENMGLGKPNPNALKTEDVIKALSGKMPDLKNFLSNISERHAFEKVVTTAKTLDLPLSKLKLIEDATGIKVIDEIEEDESQKIGKI